jgi:hypothetical protein
VPVSLIAVLDALQPIDDAFPGVPDLPMDDVDLDDVERDDQL